MFARSTVFGPLLAATACLAPLDDEAAGSGGIVTLDSADDDDDDDAADDAADDDDAASADDAADDDDDGDTSVDGGDDSTGSPDDPPVAPDGYYVVGNTVYDANDEPHLFRGVARPSLEWNPAGEGLSAVDYERMAGWGANVVRIALNQGFWLPGSSVHAPSYPEIVDQQIAWAHDAGLDVILDLHWSDRGDFGLTPDQQRMADEHSIAFWDEVATRYQDDGRVLFELYNEPHDVSWDVWRNGGDTGEGWTAVGMQTLYETVRATGAENLVIAGGLDWAYDLSGVPGDTEIDGYNVMYASHPYDLPTKQPSGWDSAWGFLAAEHPIIVSEFGSFDCDASYTTALVDYADSHALSFTAWAWYPGGCDFPALIDDWNGTPSAAGQIVRAALMGS